MNLSEILPQTTMKGVIDFTFNTITFETRSNSHNQIIDTLGDRQKSVYNHLNDLFPNGATAKELSVSMFNQRLVPSPERNSVHPRLNELIAIGMVKIVGKKTCQYTTRSVAIYKCK